MTKYTLEYIAQQLKEFLKSQQPVNTIGANSLTSTLDGQTTKIALNQGRMRESRSVRNR